MTNCELSMSLVSKHPKDLTKRRSSNIVKGNRHYTIQLRPQIRYKYRRSPVSQPHLNILQKNKSQVK